MNNRVVPPIRGPFVDLEPHPDHCSNEDEMRELCKRLRKEGYTLAADLFAGAGGISLGLEDAGFKVVLGVDHFVDAVKTHRHHFAGMSNDWDLSTEESIDRVAALMKDCEIEVLAGGPPCQPFSKAGRNGIRKLVEEGRREAHDQRRDLWRSYLEIVSKARPKAVIMENVPDMALDDEMFIIRSIIEELEQLGYSVFERVVEFWRYGVPQTRKRLILVAFRDGLDFSWPESFPQKVTLWNAIGELPEVEGGWRPEGGASGWAEYPGAQSSYQRYMRRRVPEADAHKVFDHITRPVRDDDREAFELMDEDTKYSDLPEHLRRYRTDIYDDKYKRLAENDLSRTITAHISKDGYGFIHPRQPRTITVREAARIQSFPDDFRFNGPPSAAFKQIGNAVPPRGAGAIAAAIVEALEKPQKKKCSAREVSSTVSQWYRNMSDERLSMPWLRSTRRWEATLGELILRNCRKKLVDLLWPVIKSLPAPTKDNPDLPKETLEILIDMLEGVGQARRAARLASLADQMKQYPGALWEDEIDRSKLSEITPSEAQMIHLLAPAVGSKGEFKEEHVLATSGMVRLTSRFQSIPSDKKNRGTDGRLSVARMLALNSDSRDAQRGLMELAQSTCTIRKPSCTACPLEQWCDKFSVDVSQEELSLGLKDLQS